MATFNTTQNKNALPLSPSQKYRLFLKSVTDPWPFVLTGFVAGIDQANDSFAEYGQGMAGYARRYGASYADYFTGNFFGNAVLPSLLHEDPRYFQKGTGKVVTAPCGRPQARAGASAIMAVGDRTMRISWAT